MINTVWNLLMNMALQNEIDKCQKYLSDNHRNKNRIHNTFLISDRSHFTQSNKQKTSLSKEKANKSTQQSKIQWFEL